MKVRMILTILLTGLIFPGCSGVKPTLFVHRDFNFSYLERVAVIPFENLTQDQGAGARTTRFFSTELLAAEAFEVVEPGEVTRALSAQGTLRTGELNQDQLIAIGKELGTQALFLGSVGESSTSRSGGGAVNTVTLTVRLVETDTGSTIWSATHTEQGRGFWSTLFGTAEPSMSEVTRRCVEKTIETLIN